MTTENRDTENIRSHRNGLLADGWSKRDKIRNLVIREIMRVESIVGNIKAEQVRWFGHGQQTPENRLPKGIRQWAPHERRKRGSPRLKLN